MYIYSNHTVIIFTGISDFSFHVGLLYLPIVSHMKSELVVRETAFLL